MATSKSKKTAAKSVTATPNGTEAAEEEIENAPLSTQPQIPTPPPAAPGGIERYYYVADSWPRMNLGQCRACKANILMEDLPYDDNSLRQCNGCGANTPRFEAIRGALASINMTQWSLFSCDKYVYDQFHISPNEFVTYKLPAHPPAPTFEKWLRHDSWLTGNEGDRYEPSVFFFKEFTYFALRDRWTNTTAPDPIPTLGYSWYHYGLSAVGAVPAWRQALFGAVTLVDTNPAAAVVLIAAGFEAFFIETMRIAWQESGLDETAFRRLDRNALSTLVEWLPAAVRLPSLTGGPNDLHDRWRRLVNQRRNDVVHRADIHATSEQAQESLGVALEAITFLDKFALTRPHAYFVGR